ncbi:hypothetical protein [Bryobacter aggregatus]|uniref:hypothetical protein n=1 Tax=Bryobacter aggregatus TaxID=360054 RepID=UPI0006921FAB|nr:hypothetical protein [Bryobacter aggregatus]
MKRRKLLQLPLAGMALGANRKKGVAAIVTEYRFYSHADVICGRLISGYTANNIWTAPRTQLVSLYTAQVPATDMSREMASRAGFQIYPTIPAALGLGGSRVAVDAVVFVGEHGNYPFNAEGQHLYPRYELFSQILDVYEKTGRAVPTFFDKHFSYDFAKAKEMFARSRKLGFPLMAGSSVTLSLREPYLQPQLETPMREAAVIGGGPTDAYGFHLLEVLQCFAERRKGGETGVASVEWIDGDAIWQWLDAGAGAWAKPLLEDAYKTQLLAAKGGMRETAKQPVLFRIAYRDGFRAVALLHEPSGNDRSVAIRVEGQPQLLRTMMSPTVARTLPHFDALVHCMEEMFISGKEPYPPERTLVTTGILAYAFASKRSKGPVMTPDLDIRYRAPEKVFIERA